MKWVLFIWLNTSHGVTPLTLNFANKELCEGYQEILTKDLERKPHAMSNTIPSRCIFTGDATTTRYPSP
jgi:hypothetical protein